MAEPAVLDPVTTPALDEGWIRAVLFDHAIDDWVDLGPDPIRRQHVGQIYADHVAAAYAAWKWLCDRAGIDIDTPPAAQAAADALVLEVGVTDWTELMVALLTVGRAQALLFADLAATSEEARRAFDRVSRDLAGHAALGFLELRKGTFVDQARAEAVFARAVPTTRALLIATEFGGRWEEQVGVLARDLGLTVPQG